MFDQPLQILDGQLTIFDELAMREPIALESGDLWAGARDDRPGARGSFAGRSGSDVSGSDAIAFAGCEDGRVW
jgi:hypothetical protein